MRPVVGMSLWMVVVYGVLEWMLCIVFWDLWYKGIKSSRLFSDVVFFFCFFIGWLRLGRWCLGRQRQLHGVFSERELYSVVEIRTEHRDWRPQCQTVPGELLKCPHNWIGGECHHRLAGILGRLVRRHGPRCPWWSYADMCEGPSGGRYAILPDIPHPILMLSASPSPSTVWSKLLWYGRTEVDHGG